MGARAPLGEESTLLGLDGRDTAGVELMDGAKGLKDGSESSVIDEAEDER